MTRSGSRKSWLVGFGLGIPAGFLLLEFPSAGLAITVAAALVLVLKGRPAAGIAGLLVGLGLTWVALFGRVKLTCHPDSCLAPSIDAYLLLSIGIVGIGVLATGIAWRRSRNG